MKNTDQLLREIYSANLEYQNATLCLEYSRMDAAEYTLRSLIAEIPETLDMSPDEQWTVLRPSGRPR